MPRHGHSRYPYHLAKLVAERLRERKLVPPPDQVVLRLFETMYFASFKTDEGRPCRCTVNYVDPATVETDRAKDDRAHRWSTIPFQRRLPLDVHSLTKIAEAVETTVSSLAVYSDEANELYIWGMVDQELRYGDLITQDTAGGPRRPGLFQVSINGVGNICAYKDYTLLGNLEQNALVEQYHDVLWDGPVHRRLKSNLQATLANHQTELDEQAQFAELTQVEDELLVRWQNAICRTLLNIQQHHHGGGLLIVPQCPAAEVNIKYPLVYNRLPKALLRVAQHQLLNQQSTATIEKYCATTSQESLPCKYHFDAVTHQKKLEQHRQEALGCARFIASLSRVDGFVLLDQSLTVHGFGVELRPDSELTDISVAGDPEATPRLMRPSSLSRFGTRHRAMMRYCFQHGGSLGFVISQDGDIRAMTKVGDQLVLWENINAQLAFKSENRRRKIENIAPVMWRFQFWSQALSALASS